MCIQALAGRIKRNLHFDEQGITDIYGIFMQTIIWLISDTCLYT